MFISAMWLLKQIPIFFKFLWKCLKRKWPGLNFKEDQSFLRSFQKLGKQIQVLKFELESGLSSKPIGEEVFDFDAYLVDMHPLKVVTVQHRAPEKKICLFINPCVGKIVSQPSEVPIAYVFQVKLLLVLLEQLLSIP